LPIPALVIALGFAFMNARGAYWLGQNADPAYPYLLNSLGVARGQTPYIVEHPGVPVQVLIAAALRVFHAGSRPDLPIERHVLGDPEACIRALVVGFLLLNGGALLAAGQAMRRATGSLILAWLVQASPLLSCTAMFDLADLKPEPV